MAASFDNFITRPNVFLEAEIYRTGNCFQEGINQCLAANISEFIDPNSSFSNA